MIVPQLSANDTFDLGDGLMRPDPYIMETGRVDVAAYTSDDRFAEERELFGRIWLQMGRVEELPSPGDWLVRRIDIRGVTALIVRGKDNKIRAFHNICRSEEHTSELQSLMRISYAVVCLKKHIMSMRIIKVYLIKNDITSCHYYRLKH